MKKLTLKIRKLKLYIYIYVLPFIVIDIYMKLISFQFFGDRYFILILLLIFCRLVRNCKSYALSIGGQRSKWNAGNYIQSHCNTNN